MGIHLVNRCLAQAWTTRRASVWSTAIAVCLLVSGPAPVPCESVTVLAAPAPALRVQQKARIRVLFDGKVLPNANVQVWQTPLGETSLALLTDANGEVVLPELNPGRYAVSASSTPGPGYGNSFEICLAPCSDDGMETIELVQEGLNGPMRVIDMDSMALGELWMDIGRAQDPGWMPAIAAAEREPITSRMPEFNGVVQDRTGAVIPGVSVDVVSKGTQGKKHVAMFRTDEAGRFSAQLADGDYIAFFTAPGLVARAVPFTIAAGENADELKVVLDVGSVTQTVTLSEYRPSPN
jgi:hypothetical protein